MKKTVICSAMFALLLISCKTKENSPSSINTENTEVESVVVETKSTEYTFYAIGNEPFWGLEINSKEIILRTMEDTLSSPSVKAVVKPETQSRTYTVQTDKFAMFVKIERMPCNDTMSDNSYPYSVNVQYKANRSNLRIELTGCGWFEMDKNLKGPWVLNTINNKTFQDEDFGNGLPTMSFDLKSQSFNGSTGCNRMNGSVVYQPDNFGFERVITTKALCIKGQANEDAFMHNLSQVNGYSLMDNTLNFTQDGTIILSFIRDVEGH